MLIAFLIVLDMWTSVSLGDLGKREMLGFAADTYTEV